MPFLSARTRICINMTDLYPTTRNTFSSYVSRWINLHWIFPPPRLITKLHLPRKLEKHCTIAHFPRSPISSTQTLRFNVAKEERGSERPSILWPTHHVSASPAVRAVDGWNCATWTRRGASFREDRDGASLLEDDRRGGQPWNSRRQSADGAGRTGRSSIPSRDLEDTDPCSRRLLLRPRLARGSPRPRCPAPYCRRLTSCWLICTTQRKINRALARPFVARNHVESARVSNLPSGTRHSSRTRAGFHSLHAFTGDGRRLEASVCTNDFSLCVRAPTNQIWFEFGDLWWLSVTRVVIVLAQRTLGD